MSEFDKHQIAIARKTLRLNDAGAMILGGMNKPQARDVLKRLAGLSEAAIAKIEAA